MVKQSTRTFKRPDAAEMEKITRVASSIGSPAPANLDPVQDYNNGYIVGHVYDVPLNDVNANPYNARQFSSQAATEELSESLSKTQDTAALVFVAADGSLCLFDGHRRLQSSRFAGKSTLRVEVRPPPENPQELYLTSRRANTEREDQSPLDDAYAWKLLIEKNVFASQIEIATKLGIAEATVSRIYSLNAIPKSMARILVDRPQLLNLKMLDAIRKYLEVTDEQATEELIMEADRVGMSSRDVDSLRASLEKVPSKRNRGVSVPLKFERGSAKIKRFDDQGKLTIEVSSVTNAADMDLLSEKINEALAYVLNNQRVI